MSVQTLSLGQWKQRCCSSGIMGSRPAECSALPLGIDCPPSLLLVLEPIPRSAAATSGWGREESGPGEQPGMPSPQETQR